MSSVRYEACDDFRVPLAGDLMVCATCGWWPDEHEDDSES